MVSAVEQHTLDGPERSLRPVMQQEAMELFDLALPVHAGMMDPFGQQGLRGRSQFEDFLPFLIEFRPLPMNRGQLGHAG